MKIILKLLISFIFSITIFNSFAQEKDEIKFPKRRFEKKCVSCINRIKGLPKEVEYGTFVDDSDNIFFYISHKDFFEKIFKRNNEGIAIDLVTKSQFNCDKINIQSNKTIRGHLLRKVYKRELLHLKTTLQSGAELFPLGKVPDKYHNQEYEINLLFLKRDILCRYVVFNSIDSYRWELLDMGYFLDSLNNFNSTSLPKSNDSAFLISKKHLEFTIPFENNKYEYSKIEIQPLYDSLNLTDFNIQKIKIHAYASVEGTKEHNLELQNNRAQSIINALQKYQNDSIITDITTSEDWDGFNWIIDSLDLKEFKFKTKPEIKKLLNNSKTLTRLEPYLSNHRKAVIHLELLKKNKYEDISTDLLIDSFNIAISNTLINKAKEIQESIYNRIKNFEVPVETINRLEIPRKAEFSILLNRELLFKEQQSLSDLLTTFSEFERLKEFIPNKNYINYNLIALKLRIWLYNYDKFDEEQLKKEIKNLSRFNVPYHLIKRMLVNYHIILSEFNMRKGNFKEKDISLRFINSNYKNAQLSNSDKLSIAYYLNSYAKADWAEKLLLKEINNSNFDENILFYFISLTIRSKKYLKRTNYRRILQKAVNQNKERYCNLFKPNHNGGVTFQLLEDDYLRTTYCENCN